jgi:dihydroxyacid dehydratase/phosphogluconate dehydratase
MVVVPGCDKNMPGVLMARQHQCFHVLIPAHASFPHSWTIE